MSANLSDRALALGPIASLTTPAASAVPLTEARP